MSAVARCLHEADHRWYSSALSASTASGDSGIPVTPPTNTHSGKVALVTGASRGIGRVTAIALARAGAAVSVHYAMDEQAARKTVQQIEDEGGRAIAVCGDVSVREDVRRLVAEVEHRLGDIDILVNNAGINHFVSVFNTTAADFDRLLAVNTTGAFHCVQAVVSGMRRRNWGRIISVSSDCGKRGGKISGVHFSASKAALQGLTRSLARQLAQYGITANDVAPASILTERWEHLLSKDEIEAKGRLVPTGRMGRPEDVASAICFLASPAAEFITGVSLDVAGGAYIG